MSWTSPRTWATSEVVTSSMMNTHVRDNLLETAPGKASAAGQTPWSTAANAISMVTAAKYKSGDETVNNSTTLQNDDHLSFAIAASEVWAFDMFLYFTIASLDPGMKYLFTLPASCTGTWGAIADLTNNIEGSSATTPTMFWAVVATTLAFAPAGKTSSLHRVSGVFINSTNAGTVQFQWAQNSATASNLTLKAGSWMRLTRLA